LRGGHYTSPRKVCYLHYSWIFSSTNFLTSITFLCGLLHEACQRTISHMDDSNSTKLGHSLTIIPFDPVDPKGSKSRALSSQADKPKRCLITEEDRANMRAVKAKGACLRCKVLKKQVCTERTRIFMKPNFAVR